MKFFLFGAEKRSPLWRKIRADHISQFPYCAACGRTDYLEVHHIQPVHSYPEKELDPTNLITLCDKYCHLAIGHLMDNRSWNKDVVEDARVYLSKVKNRPYKIRISSYEDTTIFSTIIMFFRSCFSWNHRS